MTALVAMEGLSGALGHSALIIGFAASLFGAASLVSATMQGKRHLLRLVSGYGWVVGLAGLAAFVVMERALIVRDWSLAYVQKVGSYDTPVLFNITALWSALEGSILLWLLLLAIGFTAQLASNHLDTIMKAAIPKGEKDMAVGAIRALIYASHVIEHLGPVATDNRLLAMVRRDEDLRFFTGRVIGLVEPTATVLPVDATSGAACTARSSCSASSGNERTRQPSASATALVLRAVSSISASTRASATRRASPPESVIGFSAPLSPRSRNRLSAICGSSSGPSPAST